MNADYFELYDIGDSDLVPVFVATTGDWTKACLDAAHFDRAEIYAIGPRPGEATLCFSDNPNMHSGYWWAATVNAERRRLGR